MYKISTSFTSAVSQSKNVTSKKHLGKLFFLSFISVIGLTGLVAGGYMIYHTYNQNQFLANKVQNYESKGMVAGTQSQQATPDELVLRQIAESSRARIESMVLISQVDETPRFALIDDMSKVTKEPFFRDVKLGDHLLIYQKTGVAILFRPSVGKIITMTYINPASSAIQQAQSPIQPQAQNQEIPTTPIPNITEVTSAP